MYTNQLIDAYKSHMKFVQYKQVAHELGISVQMLTDIRKGRAYLKENLAFFIAEQIGEDKEKVLVGLASDKAKTHEEQILWHSIGKKFNGRGLTTISMSCGAIAATLEPIRDYVLCMLC
ncbi:DUF3693 domain-containing protein [Vibrio diazotrophicus]|uniref:DUF3693 domain-containing protein n=1 Tax=Vibrio diazotrophicus TaxID=685 RepID=UPI003D2F971E